MGTAESLITICEWDGDRYSWLFPINSDEATIARAEIGVAVSFSSHSNKLLYSEENEGWSLFNLGSSTTQLLHHNPHCDVHP